MEMHIPEGGPKPIILSALKRLSFLLFTLCLIALFFWVVGSLRDFLDETQLMLLFILRYAAISLGLVSLVGCVGSLLLPSGRKAPKVAFAFFAYLFLAALSVVAVILAESLSVLSAGVPG